MYNGYAMLSSSQKQFARAAHILKLSDSDIEKLLRPHMVAEREITIQMDDGTPRTFSGWRIQHSVARGPAKGGIRFHPDVSLQEVQNLAAWMTWKTSILDLPLGGGKGGVAVNVPDLSDTEYERLARAYIRTFGDILGPNKDIAAPDVGTDERVMSWMVDEYSAMQGRQVLGVVTGKPIDKGGIVGRTEATGKGVLFATQYILGVRGQDLAGMRVSVQGFGNVGLHAALFFSEAGARVVRIGTSSSALENIDGIDVPALITYKGTHKEPIGESGYGTAISPAEILTRETDILVPAALGDVITQENVSNIQTDIIVEGANGPITPEAEEVLLSRGVTIIPDILANAGGVVVSFFEWQQNQHPRKVAWSKNEVYAALKKRMENASQHVLDTAKKHNTDLRTAAYIYAISKFL